MQCVSVLTDYIIFSINRLRKSRTSVNTQKQERQQTATRMTEISAANQNRENNKHLQDPSKLSSMPPEAGENNHALSESEESQPEIYLDLDITDMNYEHAYQPLNKKRTNDPHSTPPTVVGNKHGQPESQEALSGIYENPDGSPRTTTAIDNKDAYTKPEEAQPGIYADLDNADIDYEHLYQSLNKTGKNVTTHLQDFFERQEERPEIYEDPNGLSSTTPAVTNNIHPEPQGAQSGFYEDLDNKDVDYDYAYQHTME